MARPTKPKDLKPKAEAEVASVPAPPSGGGAAFDIKYIVMLVIVVLASLLGSAGSTYLMTTMVVIPELSKLSAAPAGDSENPDEHGGEATENQVGMNLELDEFTVNLKADAAVNGSQFLRAKMALSVKVPEAENCYAEHQASLPGPVVAVVNALPGGKVAGAAAPVDRTLLASGGEGGPSCEDIFKNNMAKYVPTVRDVINAALMKRTAGQLASLEGQEALKDEIKEQLTAIMAPNYEVLRVNFQDFIIQR
ncbi:MAG TPA: flagellar basal body-associated FliL family protein [Coleofasciculaceae cyanobacterium]|jgi:flagellar basal body-associated protein FliL